MEAWAVAEPQEAALAERAAAAAWEVLSRSLVDPTMAARPDLLADSTPPEAVRRLLAASANGDDLREVLWTGCLCNT